MPKFLKLNLNELKVQSFVTILTDKEKNMFRGGGSDDTYSAAETACCSAAETACATCNTCGTFCATCFPSACSGNCC